MIRTAGLMKSPNDGSLCQFMMYVHFVYKSDTNTRHYKPVDELVYRMKDRGGGVLKEFLGGDMPLGLWNPEPIPELVSAGFCYPILE